MIVWVRQSLGALELASLDAGCAHVSTLNTAVHLDGDLLDVRTEGTVAHTVRVADATTSDGGLTADLADFRH